MARSRSFIMPCAPRRRDGWLATSLLAAAVTLTPPTAALDCASPADLAPEHTSSGPRHHPVGRPLPATPALKQPDVCAQGVWFYDGNANRQPDANEPKLYGATRLVACSSCHGEAAELTAAMSQSVFLRQDARTLCLVCHKL